MAQLIRRSASGFRKSATASFRFRRPHTDQARCFLDIVLKEVLLSLLYLRLGIQTASYGPQHIGTDGALLLSRGITDLLGFFDRTVNQQGGSVCIFLQRRMILLDIN